MTLSLHLAPSCAAGRRLSKLAATTVSCSRPVRLPAISPAFHFDTNHLQPHNHAAETRSQGRARRVYFKIRREQFCKSWGGVAKHLGIIFSFSGEGHQGLASGMLTARDRISLRRRALAASWHFPKLSASATNCSAPTRGLEPVALESARPYHPAGCA